MAETIETVTIADEVRTRFLTYAMSVVKGRALPDVRDGLKPVQRRILYAMFQDLKLTVDKKALKCAKIVGEVMGNYHPHGDSALYEALVRMSQNWVLRVPLVYGQGNFGSVDGDPPAAYRYTEAKLTRQAELLLDELGQDTVDSVASYDGTRHEPAVLPAQFPNLLVNGTAGIAVGMATQIPPHNLGEVLKACTLLIDNPDATVANLLDKIKGPDFPLGGKILADRAALRKIYEEGVGSIKVQAEWKEEKIDRGVQIVVTSIPYGVNKGDLENTIGSIIDQRKLPQLTGQSNESNEKDGLRLVLEIKNGTDPNLVMAYLYKHTELQKTYSYNMTALVPAEDGKGMKPRDRLSLWDLLTEFLKFRLATVRRRFEYQLRQLRRRIHILEGFQIIFNALDRAIKMIRESSGKPDAAEKLKAAFKLDDEQVGAILDSQLYKIAQLEIQKIIDELTEKKKQAKEIETILASEKKLWGVIKSELEALIEKFPERRKTRMASDEDVLEFNEEAYIARENTNVVLTKNGRIKRVGRLASVETTRVEEGDAVAAVVPGSTLDHVSFFADDGAAYTMRINEVPATAGYGEPITKFFKLADGAKVVAAVTTDPRFTPADLPAKGDTPGGPFLVVATRNGFVLRLPLTAFRSESTKVGRRFVKLEEGDKVVMVRLAGAEEGVMLATSGGYVTHFPLDQVSILSGAGKGVIGIELESKDDCLGGVLVGGRFDKLVVETENGKTQDFGPGAVKTRKRGAKGEKPGARTKFARVVPPEIQLADWDAVEGKKKDAD
ncbi:DNA gyrase subunit A [Gemmata obscuriglobus]|uniref:DNA topoisomerase (ATP-hydrolyzing) n=1 Tax=Gemmata obscuriglobus TaxID=114 RepID=A0A2Z3HCS8_9BACT|nr:DNA topoisomerase (ATP-hydrolyzing) [Gemmata obscuriglobus]AWM39060.1 DNA topoisomerase [Gemmata obscuriglobus]QEG27906.1 DNA gyrase subunit A [Gemmata obscuriglobus]VTS05338.1 dna topoisomerase : DNA topoisomerase (ATP-hydrolyzing) OS=uncultured planctomycete GN=HGMM_F22C11C08 PE=4 SV=1: DNA_topoisoIV: DNA_gyraseA_C: DNA_gyraseA_C: DNA_gyraseA_C [Gemmata obscuriglobus UQM 2246]